MKVFLAHIILLLTSITLTAQPITWQKTYGGSSIDYGYSIVQTPDEGFISVGEKYANSIPATFIMRLSKYGDTLWTRTMAGNGATGVVALSDGNYLVSGWSSEDALIKIDINGNVHWTRYNECGYLKPSRDSGFFVLRGLRLKKYDNGGSVEWQFDCTSFLSSGDFRDYDITSNNGALIIGKPIDLNSQFNIGILRISYEGSISSFRRFNSKLAISHIVSAKDNMFAIAGYEGFNIKLAKYDSLCSLQLETILDSIQAGTNEILNSLILCSDNGFATAGWIRDRQFTYFVRAIRTNSDGTVLWRQNFGFGDHDEGNGIIQTRDSGFTVVGIRDNYNLGDIYIIKTDRWGYALPPVNVYDPFQLTWEKSRLLNIYPNPFNSQTNIRLELQERGAIVLTLYDNTGRLIEFVNFGIRERGRSYLTYSPEILSTGIYYCRIEAPGLRTISKLVFLK